MSKKCVVPFKGTKEQEAKLYEVIEKYKGICETFDEGVYEAINLDKCVNDRTSLGGPAPQNVLSQVERVKNLNK